MSAIFTVAWGLVCFAINGYGSSSHSTQHSGWLVVVRTLPGNFEKAGRAGFILDDYCTLPSSLDPLVLRQRQVLVGVVGAGWSRVSLWSREW